MLPTFLTLIFFKYVQYISAFPFNNAVPLTESLISLLLWPCTQPFSPLTMFSNCSVPFCHQFLYPHSLEIHVTFRATHPTLALNAFASVLRMLSETQSLYLLYNSVLNTRVFWISEKGHYGHLPATSEVCGELTFSVSKCRLKSSKHECGVRKPIKEEFSDLSLREMKSRACLSVGRSEIVCTSFLY